MKYAATIIVRPILFISWFLLLACCFAEDLKPPLKLCTQMAISEVDLPKEGNTSPPAQFIVEVTAFLENVSSKDITVPTQTYFGNEPNGTTASGSQVTALFYSIGDRVVEKTFMHPSPYRFSPVVLKPGEKTELPSFSQTLKGPKEFYDVDYHFIVDEVYAHRYGWWGGALKATATVPERYRREESAGTQK